MQVLKAIACGPVRAAKAVWKEARTILREAGAGNRLALVWVVTGTAVAVVGLIYWRLGFEIAAYGGWFLLFLFLVGIFLALAASVEKRDTRRAVWGELGVSLLVAGLLAFAVWMVGELRRPVEEREALQTMLGLERDMPGIDLQGKHMERFDLSERNLEGANLSGAHLEGASLVRANLREADLSGVDLSEANIEGADLSGADLSGADLGDATANRVDLHEARMLDADLSGAELGGGNLRGACLAESSLAGASLPGAHLERAALTEADLEGALFWFDLRRAVLTAVGLAGAENAEDAHWPPRFEEKMEKLIDPRPRPLVRAPSRRVTRARVLSAPDGDTVLLATEAGRKKVRPIGIDAPEFGEEGAGAARDALRTLLPRDSRVRYSFDRRRTDNFGREFVYLFGPAGILVNQVMLRRGLAVARIDPPDRKRKLRNVRYARQLVVAEAWARQHSKGLWETCPP